MSVEPRKVTRLLSDGVSVLVMVFGLPTIRKGVVFKEVRALILPGLLSRYLSMVFTRGT